MDNLPKLTVNSFLSALVRPTHSPEEIFPGKNVTFFNYGRQALLSLFKKKKWKKIGLPTFTCPVIYQAIIESGAQPVFVDVDEATFNVDFKNLAKLPVLDAIVIVHTFGAPVNIAQVRERFSKKTAIVEDRAHLFNPEILESDGDYVLLSLYKQFPNLGGSVLLSEEKLFPRQQVSRLFGTEDILKLILLSKIARPILNFCRQFRELPKDEDNLLKLQDSKFREIYWKLFCTQLDKLKAGREGRRAMYKRILKLLDKNLFQIQQLPSKQDDYYMLSAYIRFGTNKDRDRLLLNLRRKGIFLDRIWYNSIAPENSKGKFLAEHIVNFPLVPNTQNHLEKILDTVNQIARKGK